MLKNLFNTLIVRRIWATILIATPIILFILPVDYFDHGKSMCVSRLLFDVSCYGCGMTRAIMHLIHFDFEVAMEFNRLSFFVFPLLFILWLKWLLATFKIKIFNWF